MSSSLFPAPEGAAPLTAEELDDLIPPTITTRGELDDWEQTNILEAERWATARKHPTLLSVQFMQNLHKRMLGNVWRWAGQFRRSDKNIGNVDWPNIPAETQLLCNNATYWLENETYPLDEIAARLHHGLVAIHPFPNGNGRHARLMTDLLLIDSGAERFT